MIREVLLKILTLFLIANCSTAFCKEAYIFNPDVKYSGNLFKMSDSELLGIMFGISDNKKDEITWESTYSEEENRFVPKHYFGLNKIDTKIISKEKIGNDILVLFSSEYINGVLPGDCHVCTGVFSAVLFSKNKTEWGINSIQNFKAGGSWGSNSSLELVKRNKNNLLFVFKYVYGNHGSFHDVIKIIAFLDGKIQYVFNSESIDENLLRGSNTDCCLSVHEGIMMEFHDISFDSAFNTVLNKYGKGYQFMWNDFVYNTYTDEDDSKGLLGFCGEKSDYSYACYSNNSQFEFKDYSKPIDDLVFTITGTREASYIYDDYDKRGEAYPIKETHHFSFNETSLTYELNKDKSNKIYFDGYDWFNY